MKICTIRNNRSYFGQIAINGSKSISNRVLLLRHLLKARFDLPNLSRSNDSKLMEDILNQTYANSWYCGDAGTVMRFMISAALLEKSAKTLTGTARMHERPIKELTEALIQMGVIIEFLEKQGYPPVKIFPINHDNYSTHIQMAANISSQFISSLLMVAPFLKKGLVIELNGKRVSESYLKMTIDIMRSLNFSLEIKANSIAVSPLSAPKIPNRFEIESDWSSTAYHLALLSVAETGALQIINPRPISESLQGDSQIISLSDFFGFTCDWTDDRMFCRKSLRNFKDLSFDFTNCPDLAQTIIPLTAILGLNGRFTGLETLRIKETDRILAMQTELAKINVRLFSKDEQLYFCDSSELLIPESVRISTYDDHRMAMGFSPLLFKVRTLIIENPDVVNKSYPDFWTDLQNCGIAMEFSNE